MKLKKENSNLFIKLWLQKYTQLESAQFSQIYLGVQEVCGKRLLLHLTPKVAEKRTCAAPIITVENMKLVTSFSANETFKKRFWNVIGKFSNEDRSLLVKFITGR